MCGICGFVTTIPDPTFLDGPTLRYACSLLHHRGPDDDGYYFDQQAALAMRRLSIIDVDAGQQPVSNERGNIQVIFNGEIYNYPALRRDLERRGHRFRSRSDTEVIAHAYETYGDRCVDHFNGMFALAVWDRDARRLLLARDRLGIKPLYYWVDRGRLIFGSELKALLAHPAVPRQIDPVALDYFLTVEYVPAPLTIFQDIHKLPPGHRLIFREGRAVVEKYWDVPHREVPQDLAACREALVALLRDAVQMQMVSDVPLGAFLSGGIDSSTVVSFMAEATSSPVRTFSIGFEEDSYNELPDARTVATRFGTDHEEALLRPDVAALTQRLIGHLDEPIADTSLLPTYLVSELAARHVKVVLSGDGGDELFGGYDTYLAEQLDSRYYRRLPRWLRQQALPALAAGIPPQPAKKGLVNKVKRFVEGAALPPSLHHLRWMTFLNEADRTALYTPAMKAMVDRDAIPVLEAHFNRAGFYNPLARQQYVDIKSYLVDNILVKVDRMSMMNSLEVRVPLLDHRIVEFALNLPPGMKMGRNRRKVLLQEAVKDRLPAPVLAKSKQGFSAPVKNWLRGPLLPLMADTLSPDRLRRYDYFRPQCVDRWVAEHLAGRRNHSHRLWALMVFDLWYSRMEAVRGPVHPQPVREVL